MCQPRPKSTHSEYGPYQRMSGQNQDRLYPDLESILRNIFTENRDQSSPTPDANSNPGRQTIAEVLEHLLGQGDWRPSGPVPTPSAPPEDQDQNREHDYGSWYWQHPYHHRPPPPRQGPTRCEERCQAFFNQIVPKVLHWMGLLIGSGLLLILMPSWTLSLVLFMAMAKSLGWPVYQMLAAGLLMSFLLHLPHCFLIGLAFYSFVKVYVFNRPLCNQNYWRTRFGIC